MATAAQIHIGNVGTRFKVKMVDQDGTILTNLGSATTKTFIFLKPAPDNSRITRMATLLTDGTDGLLYYDTVSGDLDVPGIWRFQAEVIYGSGNQYFSDIENIEIFPNL